MRDTGRHSRSFSAFLVVSILLLAPSGSAFGAVYHKVSKGDTLWSIARAHGTSVRAVAQSNGIRETSTLKIGKTLVLPTGTGSPLSPTITAPASGINAPAKVRCDGVCLRSGPSTRHPVVASLRADTPVTVIGQYGSWRKVVVQGGAKGFISRSLLDVPNRAVGVRPQPLSDSDAALITTALACRGLRYRRGGTSRGGFDCSGFTRYVYAKYGVSLPHSSAAQSRLGTPVSRSMLQPGDLVFFQTSRRGISHVGIYVGDNQFVHASTPRRGVRVDSLGSSYYAKRYRGARRVK